MYIWGYQNPVFIPIGSKKTSFLVKFLVKFFHFQGTNVHLGVPIVLQQGTNVHFYTKLQFLSQSGSGQKNLIFSEIFPFLGNKCTFGGTKLQFLSPTWVYIWGTKNSFYPHRVEKTSFLVKFFHFQGTNVHLGVPNSSLYPQFASSFYPQFGGSGQKKINFQ